MLTFNLLLLNEFPDVEADRNGGRRNIVISLGGRKAAWLYLAGSIGVYLTTLAGIVLSLYPLPVIIALLTLPLAFKAVTGAFDGVDQMPVFVNAQKANVQVVLITQILFIVGLAVALTF